MCFVMDLITLLKEDALKAKIDVKKNRGKTGQKYYEGRLMGYYEVFDTIKLQLIAFQIDPKKVKFDIDPDKDLI